MKKILELDICKEVYRRWIYGKPYEPWSPVNRGTPLPYHGIRGLK